MNKTMIITIFLVLIVGVGTFFGGMKYQKSKQPTSPRQFGNGQQAQNRARTGGGQVFGEILSQDDKSITVKLPDGSSKIVLLSETTTISKATEGSKSDLKVGERVGVFGTTNSDGTVTAQNIQLNPTGRGIPMGESPR